MMAPLLSDSSSLGGVDVDDLAGAVVEVEVTASDEDLVDVDLLSVDSARTAAVEVAVASSPIVVKTEASPVRINVAQ
jgi:hypothetical protein